MSKEQETYDIIGRAMHVHTELGPGLREKPYENAMMIALRKAGIPVEQQKLYPIRYEGEIVGDCVPDLTVDRDVLVEVKAVEKLGENEVAQVLNYLRVAEKKLALLINFKNASLEWKRLVR